MRSALTHITKKIILTTLCLFAGASILFAQEVKKPISGTQIYSAYDPNAPSRKENTLQMGLQYYRNQEYSKAATLFQELYEGNPSHTNYTYYLYSLIGLHEYREAEKVVKKQIRVQPNELKYKVDLGYLYVTQGDVTKGRREYQQAIDDLPANKSVVIQLASAFMGKRETDLALETYEKGKKLLQGSYGFENELGSLYYQMQNYELMVEEYLNLASVDPTKLSIVQNRLQYYLGIDKDGSIHDALRIQLMKSTQQKPDDRFFADFLMWLSIQEKDYGMAFNQARALDRRFDKNGNIVFSVATLSIAAHNYDVAEEAFQYILDKYADEPIYESTLSGYYHAQFMKFKESPDQSIEVATDLEKKTDEAIQRLGLTDLSLQNYRDLAFLNAFYLNNSSKAIDLLSPILEKNLIPWKDQSAVKLDLADIYLFTGDPWEATLLYSQVEKSNKNEPIGHEAKLRNAKLSFYIGEYGWAESQLNILKAATTKLIANDAMHLYMFIKDHKDSDSLSPALSAYSHAELLAFERKYDSAIFVLDTLYARYSTHAIADDILYRKAELLVTTNNYLLADSLFEQIYTYFPDGILADDAIIQRITLNERIPANDSIVSSLYEKILFDYPGSIYAVEARKEYRDIQLHNEEQLIIPLPESENK